MSEQGYELEVTVRLRYKADPHNYAVEDTGDDVTAYKMARIDGGNFTEDFELLFDKLGSDPNVVITVAPILSLEY